MRRFIIASGATLLAVSFFYFIAQSLIAIFTIPVSTIVIVLGLLTTRRTGVIVDPSQMKPAVMTVDRGVFGASVYELFFSDTSLVMKRLVTARTTIFSYAILALTGFLIELLLGALAGIALGYALQEFTSQRNRLKIAKTNSLTTLGPGDLEFQYNDLKEVHLFRNRMLLIGPRTRMRISLPRGSGRKMREELEKILPGKIVNEDSVHTSDASRKQDK